MSSPKLDHQLRETLISQPDVILDDSDIMNALVSRDASNLGTNVIDLRALAMQRLEGRLSRLEDTHRSVIAAAYDNVSGTNQIHRAVLEMLDPVDFETFLKKLNSDIPRTLRVETIKLILETSSEDTNSSFDDTLRAMPLGFLHSYLNQSAKNRARPVVLRRTVSAHEEIYGKQAFMIKSEACLSLDLGANRLPGMLVLGSADKEMFSPKQGTDLLEFFRAAFERTMRRWLS